MIEGLTEKVANYKKDIVLYNTNATTEFSIRIANQAFIERKPAAELLHKYISNINAGKTIAKMHGFSITPEHTESLIDKYILIKCNDTHRLQISDSPLGTLTRIENFFKGLNDALAQTQSLLQSRQSELASAILELDKPFEHEQTILELSSELGEIETQLDLDKKEIAPVVDDETLQNEATENISMHYAQDC